MTRSASLPNSAPLTSETQGDAAVHDERVVVAREASLLAAERGADRLKSALISEARALIELEDPESALSEVRDAIRAYTGVLRATNHSPERTLVLVKEVTDSVGVTGEEKAALRAVVVRWMIDAYYAP